MVEVEAVELILFTNEGSLTLSLLPPDSPGGGQYCWLLSDPGLDAPTDGGGDVIPPALFGAFWKSPSFSGASGPGESGNGLGAAPLLSAKDDPDPAVYDPFRLAVGICAGEGVLPDCGGEAIRVGSGYG